VSNDAHVPPNYHQEAVADYLRLLRTGDEDGAFFGLIDLGPGIGPQLLAAFPALPAPAEREFVLRVLWEMRAPQALPLLAEVLRDRRDNCWRTALDGLVAFARPEAVGILEAAIAEEARSPQPNTVFLEWAREALEQAREACRQ